MGMKNMKREGGFIKAVIVFTMAFCVILAVFLVFAHNFLPGFLPEGGNATSTVGRGNPFAGGFSSYKATTNPLLDFGGAGEANYGNYGGSSGGSNNGRNTPNNDGKYASPYSGQIVLSSGTASYAYQTYEEYVTLRNTGNTSVDITGWKLTNGKGTRPVQTSYNDYFYPTADSVILGYGTEFLDPTGKYVAGDIVMKKGDVAYLVTARPFTGYTLPITLSFRENICMGYLKNYPFKPEIVNQCPLITNDPLIRTVTDECYDYVRSLSRCEDPEKEDTRRFNEETTSLCKQFIRPRLNYYGCVSANKDLPGFSTNTWRVFLGKDKEMWAANRETITLYDKQGMIVDQITY